GERCACPGKNSRRSGEEAPTQGPPSGESTPPDPSVTRRVPLESRPVGIAPCLHKTPRADCLAGRELLTADHVWAITNVCVLASEARRYQARCPRLFGGGTATTTPGRGELSDASAAPMVERARGRRAWLAGGRDSGGGGGRTVSPPARHPRGVREVSPDTAVRWHYRLCDPPQRARWRHQRRAPGLGRVRNRL